MSFKPLPVPPKLVDLLKEMNYLTEKTWRQLYEGQFPSPEEGPTCVHCGEWTIVERRDRFNYPESRCVKCKEMTYLNPDRVAAQKRMDRIWKSRTPRRFEEG